MKDIAQAFIKAKKAFAPALKDKTNPHFRSKYADLGACIEAVDDALLANGIAMYQETTPDHAGIVVETVLLHESGESIRSGKLHVPASRLDPQGFGSALTYARRYSLMAACGIAPEDDDGNAASHAKPVSKITAKGSLEDEYNKLDDKEKKWLNEIAGSIADWVAEGKAKEAMDELDAAIPYLPRDGTKDAQYKAAIQHLLPTNVMKAIKEVRAQLKEAA